jgi:hypothetical protein
MAKQKLTAEALRDLLWDSVQKVRSGQIQVDEVTAIAASAREIMKSVKEERIVAMLTDGKTSRGFREFYALDNQRLQKPEIEPPHRRVNLPK